MSANLEAEAAPGPPPDSHVMLQRWEDLLFLHWETDPELIRRSLPKQLDVDRFDGRAYVGLVPFWMRGVRPRFCPAVPWVSDFLELNVRTYVRDAKGRAGVWFYSLDCNQAFAVWIAQTFFKLPYFRATMRADRGGANGEFAFRCRRAGYREESTFAWRAAGPATPCKPGSLDAFLVERYRLFSAAGGNLFTGKVSHPPYLVAPVALQSWSDAPLAQAGFLPRPDAPCHARYAPGVNVRVHPLRPA